jgi:hypothetical protein
LDFADESLHSSAGVQLRDANYQDLMEYRKRLLDHNAGLSEVGYSDDMRVWAGLKPYPLFELGILAERQQDGTTSGIRPRKLKADWPQRRIVHGQCQIWNCGNGIRGLG